MDKVIVHSVMIYAVLNYTTYKHINSLLLGNWFMGLINIVFCIHLLPYDMPYESDRFDSDKW